MNLIKVEEMNKKTMSSLEIAKLTGKDHGSIILRDIRKMLISLGITETANLQSQYKGERRMEVCYNLPKDLTLTLVSGYNVQMRYAIIKRWEQLEEVVKDLDVISKVKAIALTGDFNAATKAVSELCNDSEQIGKVGSKLMTERKRQKKEAKKLIEEVSARFQLDLF